MKNISTQEIPDMMVMLKEENLWQLLSENRQALLLDERPVIDKIDETEEGKNELNCNKQFCYIFVIFHGETRSANRYTFINRILGNVATKMYA